MRKLKKIMLLIIIFMLALILKENTVFAESTIQVIPTKNDDTNSNVSAWTDISVSNAYEICQNLNKSYSTLGTDKLKAHLTTNADWYAVSLLTYSSYGSRSESSTTGNKTGINRFGLQPTYTSALIEGSTSNTNVKALYDNLIANSPYVEKIEKNVNIAQNIGGRGVLENEYFVTNHGGKFYGNTVSRPVCVRYLLFGFAIGQTGYTFTGFEYSEGSPKTSITFRPVIWNK